MLLARTRNMLEIISQNWKEQWELRILVLLSLTFQTTLVALGDRRNKIHPHWIRFVIWIAYLSADAVAIFAAGIIRIEPLLANWGGGSSNKNAIDPTTQLRALWAPFLLLHLGGPDTITAYALEDNELWLIHSLTLVSQAVVTLYILLLSWSGSYISWLNVVIFICGLIKYSERVWALWSASSETFRDSTPERHKRIPKLMEEQILKEAEGHVVLLHEVSEPPPALDHGVGIDWETKEEDVRSRTLYERRQGEILLAGRMIDIFRPAFTDQVLGLDDARSAKETLKGKNYQSVFNIIAIELGFIYDLLFTKAMLFRTPWGVASRVVTLSLTSVTLVVFTFASLDRKNASQYNKTDLHITFLLVVAAVFLELYVFLFQHLFSDKFIWWLIMYKHSSILRIVNQLRPLSKQRRWSGKIGQFSLLSYSFKEKHFFCRREIKGINKCFYLNHLDAEDFSMDFLYASIQVRPIHVFKDLRSTWADKDPETTKQLESLEWSISKDLEFDLCVLIWHIATDICYHVFDVHPSENAERQAEVSLHLSRYMLYLLLMYPSLLPTGIGRIKFKDMHSTVTTFFENYRSAGVKEAGNRTNTKNDLKQKRKDACNLLLNQVNTQLNLTVSTRNKSKFVMFCGCKLASQLKEIKGDERFNILCVTWIGLLIQAALNSKASFHLKQLRHGGELITHVWLLLVHSGFTSHFKIPKSVEIAEMIIK